MSPFAQFHRRGSRGFSSSLAPSDRVVNSMKNFIPSRNTLKTVGIIRRWTVTGFLIYFAVDTYQVTKAKQKVRREFEEKKQQVEK